MPSVLVALAMAVLALGGFICLANFRLFLAWLRHCLRPDPKPPHPHVSAIPIIGSLLVFLMLRPLADFPAAQSVGWLLIAVDMGGLHWMILGLPYALYRNRRQARSARRDEDGPTP